MVAGAASSLRTPRSIADNPVVGAERIERQPGYTPLSLCGRRTGGPVERNIVKRLLIGIPLALLLVASLVVGVSLVGESPARALDTNRCGGYMDRNRDACFEIRNATEGFSSVGKFDLANGIKFIDGKWAKESGWVVRGPGGEEQNITEIPAAAGYDTPDGAVRSVVMSQTKTAGTATGAWGTYSFEPSRANWANEGPLKFLIGIGYSVSDEYNCTGTNPYIDCGMPNPLPGGNKARFDMTITNRPVVVRIVNQLENHLKLVGTVTKTNFLQSVSGTSKSLNIAASENRLPGEATLAGYAKFNKQLSLTLDYQVGDLAPSSLLPDDSKGSTLSIRIIRNADGTSSSRCDVTSRTGATTLTCQVAGENTGVVDGPVIATVNIG